MLTEQRKSQELAERAVSLKRQILELESKQKQLKSELDQVLLAIPKTFTKEKIKNIPYDGATVFFQREIQISKNGAVPTNDFLKLLREAGLGEFVNETYNIRGIKALLYEYDRELRDEGYVGDWREGIATKVPEEILSLLNIHEEFKGRIRNP